VERFVGASGGVGTILVQLARHAGARVIGTASPRHHDALRAMDVEPIDYRDPDLAARVRELAPGGVGAVFDHLGGASVTRSYHLLNRTGTLVSYSIASKLDDTSPLLPGFLRLLAKLAVWNYLRTRQRRECPVILVCFVLASPEPRPTRPHSRSDPCP
jgi:NADPH:quinone reductase-like Zn-dependent oxidoreductase